MENGREWEQETGTEVTQCCAVVFAIEVMMCMHDLWRVLTTISVTMPFRFKQH